MTYQPYTVLREARLDQIAKLIYGSEKNGVVEALLAANNGLAEIASAVPRGTVLVVPDKPETSTASYVRPWE